MQNNISDCTTVIFTEYILSLAEELKLRGHYSTSKNYLCAIRSFSRWLGPRRLELADISDTLIEKYSIYLTDSGVSRNTASCYLRSLRAAYNRAVEAGLAMQNHPFKKVWTGVDRTLKRAIPDGLITAMTDLHLVPGSELDFTRDIFLFSFSMRGMAFIDIACLTTEAVTDRTVLYARRKTGKTLIVKIEPFQSLLIKKYEGRGGRYVFPILKGSSSKELYACYCTALRTYNRHLKTIAKMLHTDIDLTSYTARHSWATSARNHDIPIPVISAALGHSSCRTTEIYLADLEDNVVDTANKMLIQSIFRDCVNL